MYDNLCMRNAKELKIISETTTESIRVRSKCQWYEEQEESAKLFLDKKNYMDSR